MNLFEAALLGIIQGVTEFLPISSSGHLLLARDFLGIVQDAQAAFIFDVLVQLGTWVAILIYYWKDVAAIGLDMAGGLRGRPGGQARLGWLLLLASVPAVIAGWLIKDSLTGEVSGLFLTGIFLVTNALLLSLAELVGRRVREIKEASGKDALWIGMFQALALLPAVSRSAATLAGGLTRNFTRPDAARFAFLMAVPVMPAAAVVALLDLGSLPEASELLLPLVTGFLVSTVVGYLSIRWLLNYLARHSLFPFAVYCLVAGFTVGYLGWLG
ncbi:MAG: undecaprenyl-diphosphate phosphatase [Anaerolineales bacterium]